MTKYVKLKMENRDFPQIAAAFTTAILLLHEKYQKPKQGNESESRKLARKQYEDKAQKLIDAHTRIIEYMKDMEFCEE